MKHITILVPESAVILGVTGPRYLFTTINEFYRSKGKGPIFNVQLAGLKKEVQANDGMFSMRTDVLLQEVKKTDIIIIPPLLPPLADAVEKNRKMIPWITAQYAAGTEVASLCTGAFLLGATGLLDGKKCSTHWSFVNEFRDMYPQSDVVDGSIITEESCLYSSGGANSNWNLLLHLLEKYTDRPTAILAAKYFAIDIDRDSQAAFAMFKGQKDHADTAIKQAQEYIEKNFSEKISVDELADKTAIGRRSLERRFKLVTKHSVLDYIQRVKMEAAKRSFENSRKNVNEVMYDVGYTDTKAFRTIFKKITGLTPVEYRNKYNKSAVMEEM